MRLLSILALALPLAAQPIQVACPAPGNLTTITYSTPFNSTTYLRIEDNPDGAKDAHDYPTAKAKLHQTQAGPLTPSGTVTISTSGPGPKLAYALQNDPYIQGASDKGLARQFTCDAPAVTVPPPPPPPPAPTPTPSNGSYSFGSGLATVQVANGPTQVAVDQTQIGLRLLAPPTSSNQSCQPGSWAMETGWYYLCIAPSTWRRTALTAW